MLVLSICTISGSRGARSRPVASISRRTGLACRRNTDSTALRARVRTWGSGDILVTVGASLLAEMLDDALENLVELDRRLVADKRSNLGDVRHASRHVFEASLVG